MTIVFLLFSPLLHVATCLPADSPVTPAQILLQLISDCEPVTLHLLPKRPIVLCTCLPADSSPAGLHWALFYVGTPTTVARNRPIFPTETIFPSFLSQKLKLISLMSLKHQDTQVVGLPARMDPGC
ncbi:hypothetical protein AVEN_264593-1 [Araneus ventricosus]|uniref:Secreted protein n=1 Tax=Araneus ventricosus TaxID=182803 RepID=A0A4Y2VZU5_ARAVE|nr:hypothetical protein AVEN_264593-1 [Araneus ventricosus]